MSRFTLFPLEKNGWLNFGGNQETHNFALLSWYIDTESLILHI